VTPEQAARRWRERRTAQSRRDVELETFPTTGGSQARTSHPMFGAGRGQSPQAPVVPVAGAEVVMPVGWYHPLTIQRTETTVTGWNDVSGWNRHMETDADPNKFDYEFGKGIDNRNAVIVPQAAGDSTLVNTLFTPVFDQIAFPYGFTVFLVAQAMPDPGLAPGIGKVVDVSASSFLFRFYHADSPDHGQQFLSYGLLQGDDTSARGPTVFALWVPWDGSEIAMEVNGKPWVDESTEILSSRNEPYEEQWIGFTNSFNIEHRGAGAWVSELIIIPAALSVEGRFRWWQYFRAEYPSAF